MRELQTASSEIDRYLYQDFFMAAGEALLILDQDDCIVDANPAAQRLLGIDDLTGAREKAYAMADQIQFEGKQLRRDIGA